MYSQPRDGAVRVIVVRDSGALGAANAVKLSINEDNVAEFWSGDRLALFLMPDTYIFAIEPAPHSPQGYLVEKQVFIQPGKQYAFRISLDYSRHFSLRESTELE